MLYYKSCPRQTCGYSAAAVRVAFSVTVLLLLLDMLLALINFLFRRLQISVFAGGGRGGYFVFISYVCAGQGMSEKTERDRGGQKISGERQ